MFSLRSISLLFVIVNQFICLSLQLCGHKIKKRMPIIIICIRPYTYSLSNGPYLILSLVSNNIRFILRISMLYSIVFASCVLLIYVHLVTYRTRLFIALSNHSHMYCISVIILCFWWSVPPSFNLLQFHNVCFSLKSYF